MTNIGVRMHYSCTYGDYSFYACNCCMCTVIAQPAYKVNHNVYIICSISYTVTCASVL